MDPFSSQFWYPYGSKFLAWSAHPYLLLPPPQPHQTPSPPPPPHPTTTSPPPHHHPTPPPPRIGGRRSYANLDFKNTPEWHWSVLWEWHWSGSSGSCNGVYTLEWHLGVLWEWHWSGNGVCYWRGIGVHRRYANYQYNATPMWQWSGRGGVAMECTLHCHSSKLLEMALVWWYVKIKIHKCEDKT